MDAVRSRSEWRKSSYCSGANTTCVEIATNSGSVLVRDSKDPAGPVLSFTRDEWRMFLLGAAAGEFG